MTKAKKSKTQGFLDAVRGTCPPALYAMIEREGGVMHAAKAAHMGSSTIAGVAHGKLKVSPQIQKRIDAYHAGKPLPSRKPDTTAEPQPEPEVVIPPWDKKTVSLKITKSNGQKQTLKLPTLIADLMGRHDNSRLSVAKAMGYGSWNGVSDALDKGKYAGKLHDRAYRAINGLPIPGKNGNGASTEADTHALGIAICVVSLSEYERLEELAEVMGGHLVFRMPSGAGLVVIYRIHDRAKRETFKRLAMRDAKKIVCP